MKHIYMAFCCIMLAAWLVPMGAGAQDLDLSGYTFSTGVDATKWKTLTTPTSICPDGDDEAGEVQPIGFTFTFAGTDYTHYSVCTNNYLKLGGGGNNADYGDPFDVDCANIDAPKITGFGRDGKHYAGTHHVLAQTFGDTMLVVEFLSAIYGGNADNDYTFQIQLFASGRVQIVYKQAPQYGVEDDFQVGMCTGYSDGWIVASDNTATYFTSGSTVQWTNELWPANGRYYLWNAPVVTCPKPTGLTVAAIGMNDFTIQWNPVAEAVGYMVRKDGYDHNTTGTTYSFVGLSSGTQRVQVASLCEGNDTSWLVMCSVSTPVCLPYDEDFDLYTNTADGLVSYNQDYPSDFRNRTIPDGWWFPGGYSGSSPSDENSPCMWVSQGVDGMWAPISTSVPGSVSHLEYKTWEAIPAYAALPVFNAQASTLTLSFKYLLEDNDCYIYLGIMTNLANEASAIASYHRLQSYGYDEDWQTVSVSLASVLGGNDYLPGTYRLVLEYHNPAYGLGYRGYVDEVTVNGPSLNPPPTDLTVSGITSRGATLNWTDMSGGMATYTIRVGGVTVATVPAGTTAYTLTGLTPSTNYSVEVEANCSTAPVAGAFRTLDDDCTPTDSTMTVEACNTYTWIDGNAYTASTTAPTYVYAGGNAEGCDSTVYLHLTINTSTTTDTLAQAFESMTWRGVTYTETPAVDPTVVTHAGIGGCDDMLRLRLRVFHLCHGTLPYSEDFNSYTGAGVASDAGFPADYPSNYPFHDVPTCWYFPNTTMSANVASLPVPATYLTSKSAHRYSGNGLRLRTNKYADPPTAVVASDFGLPSSRLDVQFKYKVGHSNNITEWGVMTDPADATSFIMLGSTTSTAWVTVRDSLYKYTSLPTGTLYLAFRSHRISTSGTSAYSGSVEDVVIRRWCDSSIANVTAVDSYTWTAGTGATYTVSGSYRTTVPGAGGCDSILHLNLTIGTECVPTDSTMTVEACDSYTWIDGNAYTASTTAPTYVYADGNAGGCDSTVYLHLTINHSTTGDTVAEECDQFTWWGDSYNASTETPTHTYASAAGCDSVVTLHLTINVSTAGDTTAEECDQFTWWGDSYSASTEAPTHTYSSAAGCDSVVTLHLTINVSTAGDTVAVECDQFTWWGDSYNASTEAPTHTYTNAAGCDSVVTLHLTINVSTAGDTTAVECDQFTWWGDSYNASTEMPTHTFTNAAGCDSVVTLHLTINNSTTGDTTAVECGQFTWWGDSYSTSTNTPTHTYTGAAGCDSVVTLHLTVNGATAGTIVETVCNSKEWKGATYTASGTYQFDTLNVKGCDSTLTLTLTVHHSSSGAEVRTVCDSLVWNGTTYYATGTATYNTQNVYGCDSVVSLTLTVRHSTVGETTAEACDRYAWHGSVYTATTEDTWVGDNAVGCDSTETLHLTILRSSTRVDRMEVCDTFTWNGTLYTQSTNTPFYTMTNALGCDSTVRLDLTVHHRQVIDTVVDVCDRFEWYGDTYESDNVVQRVWPDRYGCDSAKLLHLTVRYTTYSVERDTTLENDLPYRHSTGTVFSDAESGHHLTITNAAGCDSVIEFTLVVVRNKEEELTSAVCANHLPLEWSGLTLTRAGDYTARLMGSKGEDSTVHLHLQVLPSYRDSIVEHVCNGGSVTHGGESYWEQGIYPVEMRSIHGCDSTLVLDLRTHELHATLKASTEVLRSDKPGYTVYDASTGDVVLERAWYVDGLLQSVKGAQYSGEAQSEVDSVEVMLKVTSEFCVDTTKVVFPVYYITPYTPNVFTPLDETNNRFVVYIRDVQKRMLSIYDRTGRLVYKTDDPEGAWDGRSSSGDYCQQGNYVWRQEYVTNDEPTRLQSVVGTVLLLK